MDIPRVLGITHPEAGKVSLTLAIDADLDVFTGHFDGVPIVPGVAQLYWAVQFANEHLQPVSAYDIEQMEAVKFHHVMRPGLEVLLMLELEPGKLTFAFSSGSTRYSSGRVALVP